MLFRPVLRQLVSWLSRDHHDHAYCETYEWGSGFGGERGMGQGGKGGSGEPPKEGGSQRILNVQLGVAGQRGSRTRGLGTKKHRLPIQETLRQPADIRV